MNEIDVLKEKLRIAKDALLTINTSASVPESAMFNAQTVGEYWKHIASKRREVARQAIDRIERVEVPRP